jgi:hypothetical protein
LRFTIGGERALARDQENNSVKLLFRLAFLLSVCTAALSSNHHVSAQEATAETIQMVHLLPEETQGFVQVASLPQFVERWNQTQLGILGNDEKLADFWKTQREEIQKRFADAGWQLNLKAQELYEIATGQAGVAWVAQTGPLPNSVCLVMDVSGKEKQAEALLERAGKQLLQKGASSKDSQVAGTAVREYTLPLKAGERRARSSFYSLTETQLFATDDLALLSNLINAYKKGGHEKPLANEKTFVDTINKLDKSLESHDLQYFFRPIGFAKALRSISGRPASGEKDLLKVLENQGFGSILAIAGRIRLKNESFDLQHEAFVKLDEPVPEAVQLLDFPNTASFTLPNWVSDSASTVTSFAWNAEEAFWKVRPIVDEVAGRKGTFDEVIQSIHEDPLGPQIDVKKQVLPYLTNQFFIVTDTEKPITIDSRRALVAIQVNDPNDELSKVLKRAMNNEPDAIQLEYRGHFLWKVHHEEEEYDLDVDTGEFNLDKAKKPGVEESDTEEGADTTEAPLLNNWAIAKFDNYLFFASHEGVIEAAMDAAMDGKGPSKFLEQADVAPAAKALDPDTEKCAWRIIRLDRDFEMQYELFREGKLPQNQSIIATILDRILRPRDQAKDNIQKVKGDKLPPFDAIKDYLMPVGYSAQTTDEGWIIKTFVLGK